MILNEVILWWYLFLMSIYLVSIFKSQKISFYEHDIKQEFEKGFESWGNNMMVKEQNAYKIGIMNFNRWYHQKIYYILIKNKRISKSDKEMDKCKKLDWFLLPITQKKGSNNCKKCLTWFYCFNPSFSYCLVCITDMLRATINFLIKSWYVE